MWVNGNFDIRLHIAWYDKEWPWQVSWLIWIETNFQVQLSNAILLGRISGVKRHKEDTPGPIWFQFYHPHLLQSFWTKKWTIWHIAKLAKFILVFLNRHVATSICVASIFFCVANPCVCYSSVSTLYSSSNCVLFCVFFWSTNN